MKHVGILSSFSAIFGKKQSKSEIIDLIQKTPLLSSFILLSQLSTDSFNEKDFIEQFKKQSLKQIEKEFIHNPSPGLISEGVYQEFEKDLKKLDETVTLSPQSILNLWKWLLAYKENKEMKYSNVNDSVFKIIYLALLTNDYLTSEIKSEDELFAQVFSNAVFSKEENGFNSLSRTYSIYIDIAQDESLFKGHYLDLNKDFRNEYGYSIKEYISVIFGLITSFLNLKEVGQSWLLNIDEVFTNSKLNDISKEIVNSLSIDINSASSWSADNIDSIWNFQKFREKPLLFVNDKQYLPISLKLLYEQLFTGLFHKIRHIYPINNKSFLDFYGMPFQKYTESIICNSIQKSKLKYTLIPEFRYLKTKDSPDIMIRLGNKLLAIEVKSYRLRLPSITDADKTMIDQDTRKMIIKPLEQVHDRIKELIEIEHKALQDIDDIYLMVVTQGQFPTLEPYEKKIESQLNKHFKIPIKGWYHLDIEEFELLCSLLERRRPIFRVLDNKNKQDNIYEPFKNFVFDNNYHLRKNKFIEENFSKITNEMQFTLFDKT